MELSDPPFMEVGVSILWIVIVVGCVVHRYVVKCCLRMKTVLLCVPVDIQHTRSPCAKFFIVGTHFVTSSVVAIDRTTTQRYYRTL